MIFGFCLTWVKTVKHHHDTEERTYSLSIEDFIKKPDLVEDNQQQHEVFPSGLDCFLKYVRILHQRVISFDIMKKIVDRFAFLVIKHLIDEWTRCWG